LRVERKSAHGALLAGLVDGVNEFPVGWMATKEGSGVSTARPSRQFARFASNRKRRCLAVGFVGVGADEREVAVACGGSLAAPASARIASDVVNARNANRRRVIFMRLSVTQPEIKKGHDAACFFSIWPEWPGPEKRQHTAALESYFFLRLLLPGDGGGGDSVVVIEAQQSHALRGAARFANFVRVHADDLAFS